MKIKTILLEIFIWVYKNYKYWRWHFFLLLQHLIILDKSNSIPIPYKQDILRNTNRGIVQKKYTN